MKTYINCGKEPYLYYYRDKDVKEIDSVPEHDGVLNPIEIKKTSNCSNMAKLGMNPKILQYLMGHSDISVTMNVYTHISFDNAEEELKRMEEFRKA